MRRSVSLDTGNPIMTADKESPRNRNIIIVVENEIGHSLLFTSSLRVATGAMD